MPVPDGAPQWGTPSPRGPASLQQQNPMLNAQLSQGTFAVQQAQARFVNQVRQQHHQQQQQHQHQQQQQQQQMVAALRSLPSPGSAGGGGPTLSRNPSPFPPSDQFPPSPVGALFSQGGPSPGAPQGSQQQQVRLQRAMSVPARVNSPRTPQQSFGGVDPLLSPPGAQPQMSPGASYSTGAPATSAPVFNLAQDATPHFSFDQQTLQIFSTGSERGRGAGGGSMPSEYVRQELRAIVGARTQQQQGQAQQLSTMHQLQSGRSLCQAELEALGLHLEMAPGDSQPSSPASLFSQSLLGPTESSMPGLPTPSPRMDDAAKPGDQRKSLLQQLLSEPT